MTFSKAFKTCLRKYVGFKGRASRSEFWLWIAFVYPTCLFMYFADILLFGFGLAQIGPLLAGFYALIFLPSAAVSARRFQDTDRNGWWIWWWGIIYLVIGVMGFGLYKLSAEIALNPEFFGWGIIDFTLLAIFGAAIWEISWLTQKSMAGENRYGASPLEKPAASPIPETPTHPFD